MSEPELDTLEDSAASRRTPPRPLHPFLFLVLECDRPHAGGARVALHGVDEVVIGRGPERTATHQILDGLSKVYLRIPGRSVSSTHARLLRAPSGWIIEDLRSTNGVSVNGRRIERAELSDGDVIEIGHSLFILRVGLPAVPGGPVLWDPAVHGAPGGLATLLPMLAGEFSTLERVARSELPILLLGDTGTGKEVVARAVHRLSGRSGAFIAVNCGALAPNLVESQLFGHAKGAFSGATRDEPGFFRAAHGGTLLLDEIGDLPAGAQPALLRVLQEQEVVPVGASRSVRVDVRVIAATHRPLDQWAAEERFRRDLLARLNGYRLELPPLCRRREDIGLFVAECLREAARAGGSSSVTIAPRAGLALLTSEWPLNIRELAQHLRRGLVLAPEGPLNEVVLGLADRQPVVSRSTRPSSRPESEADLRLKSELLKALEQHRGNVTSVARAMGKKRMQIQRWMKRFGVQAAAFREIDGGGDE